MALFVSYLSLLETTSWLFLAKTELNGRVRKAEIEENDRGHQESKQPRTQNKVGKKET